MVYFDHAATSLPKPDEVLQAVLFALKSCGNATRGTHHSALIGLHMITELRHCICTFFDVESPDLVAFTPNATAALNIAIAGVKGHIVTTAAEHNSVLRPVYRHGNYSIVPVDEIGRLNYNQLAKFIQSDTEAVVITHASNVTGTVYDLAHVSLLCHKKKVRLIVDASQTAGLLPINMQQLHISALCFSGHKSLFGPQGTGVICLGEGYSPDPLLIGGSGVDSFSTEQPLHMPERLEAGTQNTHGLAGLLAGIQYVQSQNGACFSAADQMARFFISELQRMQAGYQIYGDLHAPVRIPVVAINHPNIDAAELAFQLANTYQIAVRAGAHCAPLMHQALGTQHIGSVRFSFSHMHTKEDILFAIDALKQISTESP